MSIPYIIKPDSATMFFNGRGVTVASDHVNFKKIITKLEAGDEDIAAFQALVDIVAGLGATVAIADEPTPSQQNVTYDTSTGTLRYKGYPLSGYIATKATELYKAGSEKPLKKLLAFLENLYNNPRSSIAERLYRFIEIGNMPITEDGYFLAYKKIRNDWKDIYTGTMDNSVGKILEMPRVLVNDKDTETCSTGLHFCSYAYLSHFGNGGSGNRVVVLKINPADVVSIPTDYNDTKGRACRYEILSEITNEATKGPVLSKGPGVVAADAYRTPVQNANVASVVTPSMHTKPYTLADAVKARSAAAATPSTWPMPATAVTAQFAGKMSDGDVALTLQKFTNTQLVAFYNAMAIHPIDHFRDKATGIKRLMALTDRATLEAKITAI